MYNRILKRPMFKMGGRSYSAQGTGITSGLDTPRRGLVQYPGGYAGRTLEEIETEKIKLTEPRMSETDRIIKSLPNKFDTSVFGTPDTNSNSLPFVKINPLFEVPLKDVTLLDNLVLDDIAFVKEILFRLALITWRFWLTSPFTTSITLIIEPSSSNLKVDPSLLDTLPIKYPSWENNKSPCNAL